MAVGWAEPEVMARRILEMGPDIAIVKRGGDGVVVAWAGGVEHVPPVRVKVVNGLGAGDAFGGAVCHGLLAGWDPPRLVRFAAAAGAYVAGRLACADEMPSESQVRELMARHAAEAEIRA
jgi:5-dehydro-2-deoxygluconokinase